MKKLLLFLVLLPAYSHCFAEIVKIGLSEALKTRMVVMEAVNTAGAYKGKTTKITLTNNTANPLQVKIELGTILRPDDSFYQPMVLSGEELIVLQPMKKNEADVYTFCGNSPRSCPSRGSHYSYMGMGSNALIELLRFVKSHALYDYLGQDAVWVITNNHSIANIYDADREALTKQLIDLLCKVTGRPKPDYYALVNHIEVPDQPAYVPKPLKIIANFEILLDTPKTLTLGVYDEQGKMIQPVFENQEFKRAGHRFGVEFESADVPSGNYHIMLKEGANILQKKTVHVD